MLGEFLGITFDVETYDGDYIEITRTSHSRAKPTNESKLTIDASFFYKAHLAWLNPESMPLLPLANWKPVEDGISANLVEASVPILYGNAGLVRKSDHIHINLDIFGSAFFMLSRYEELVTKDRDNHDRFPASASVAFKAGFLDRPIVNEYLEILWECLYYLWPTLVRKERKFRKLISCDVDHPFDLVGYSLKRTILRVGARIIRDKNPKLALRDGLNYIFKKFGSDYFDEYRKNIEWIMKVNDQAGNRVSFYFIPIQTDKNKDDPIDLRTPEMVNLFREIVNSGHTVGFHPGYSTYNHSRNFKKSSEAFKEALVSISIPFNNMGGRQHYLRYNILKTPQLWQQNNFTYDSSLGYEDKPGFRCGVCYQYKMFDFENRLKMDLLQKPLIIMECTVLGPSFSAFIYSNKTYKIFDYFKSVCKQFEGDYVILWHNSYFRNEKLKSFYEKIV